MSTKERPFEMDFRVGGRQTSSFRFRGGPLIHNDTVYQDIVPDERIIFAYTMTAGGERISASLVTVEIRPRGRDAELIFTEHGAFLDGHDDVGGRESGTDGLLDALGEWLASNPDGP